MLATANPTQSNNNGPIFKADITRTSTAKQQSFFEMTYSNNQAMLEARPRL